MILNRVKFNRVKLNRAPVFISLAIFILSVSTAGAQSSTADELDEGWSFRIAPYAWATAITGTAGAKGVESDVDMSINDVIDNLDGALMTTVEVKYNRFSFISDFVYAKLSDSAASPRGVLFEGADATLKEFVYTGYLGYTAVDVEHLKLDLLAGLRVMNVSSDLDLNGAALESRSFSGDKSWVDPVIGLRAHVPIAGNFSTNFLGDIGGFDAASKLTWQTTALLVYSVTDCVNIGAGYRALGDDYESGGFKYDLVMHGPIFGMDYTY